MRNPFRAKPEGFHGPVTRGVEEFPGFHTACNMVIAQPYAQLKVSESLPSSVDDLETPINDYPVIIELDMAGIEAEIDYDAAHWFSDAVQVWLSVNDNFDDFESALEGDSPAPELETPDSMIGALFYLSGQSPDMAAFRLRDWLREQKDPDAAFQNLKENGIPKSLLADVSCQYRYVEDVPAGRIVAVHYIKPVFDRLLPHYEDEDYDEEEAQRIEEAGYDVVDLSNVYDDNKVMTIVATIDLSSNLFQAGDPRIEFHGTSYRNLLLAAPWLKDQLPEPPWPYSPEEPE